MKRRISIAVDKNDNQIPDATGISISDLVNDVIGKEAHRIKLRCGRRKTAKGWKTPPNLSHRMVPLRMKIGTGDRVIRCL